MLLVTRKSGQSVYIYPSHEIDQSMTIGELFEDGAIEIVILESTSRQQRMGINAPKGLAIVREEAVNVRTRLPAFA